jgi:uncharacterized protein with ParB-like and HNH nuclease domain
MAEWVRKKIVDVMEEIKNGVFVLPVIQREWVWPEKKMVDLFDTLLKGDSFGGIVVIKEIKDRKPLFTFRPFTLDGNNQTTSTKVDKLHQEQLFVIDGQQRLQSFYIGFYGSIGNKTLYFDLFSEYTSKCTSEYTAKYNSKYTSKYEFKFGNDIDKLPKQLKDNSNRQIQKHLWYSIKNLIPRLRDTGKDYEQVVKEIINEKEITDEIEKEHIKENVRALFENVVDDETLGISIVTINKKLDEVYNIQRIVELFKRLNDGGTPLTSFDIIVSILKGFQWELEVFLRDILKEYKDIGLDLSELIKLIFLLRDDPNKKKEDIDAYDAEFIIKNKERIKTTIKSLKDFLEWSRLYDYYKTNRPSFVPLRFIAYHLFHKDIDNEARYRFFDRSDTSNADFHLIKRWIFNSLINSVFIYNSGVGWRHDTTGVIMIFNVLKEYKNKPFPTQELFDLYYNRITVTLDYDTNNIDTLNRKFVYYLMYMDNPVLKGRINDIDHVMPKSILGDLKYSSENINNIKNHQLLEPTTNRDEKKAKPFSEWVNNSEYVKDKADYIKIHLIPPCESLWDEVKFLEFSEERCKLILEKVREYTK